MSIQNRLAQSVEYLTDIDTSYMTDEDKKQLEYAIEEINLAWSEIINKGNY